MTVFEVFDPKRRTISVAPFRDRVVHHAVVGVIQPHLERGFDPDSYGCRTGMGTDGALARAVQLARRHPWCLRTDVRAFFASVDLGVLLAQLQRKFKDRRLLELLEGILRHPAAVGLPIGNLTSQWFANLYLTPLDHHVRTLPECRGWIRYMDDGVVLGATPRELTRLAGELIRFCAERLKLTLKAEPSHLHRTATGFPFLGFRVSRRGLAVRRESWRRITRRLRAREREYLLGRIDLELLAASARSWAAHLDRARTRALRRRFLADHAPVEW